MIKSYSTEVEIQMQELYSRLSEKDRRLYAGIEASKLPHGGVSYIARLFSCSRDTILRGIKELNKDETMGPGRSRKTGGGRKQLLEKQPDINEIFILILKEHTAGDPMDEKVKWTNLTCAKIASLLSKQGFKVTLQYRQKIIEKT